MIYAVFGEIALEEAQARLAAFEAVQALDGAPLRTEVGSERTSRVSRASGDWFRHWLDYRRY